MMRGIKERASEAANDPQPGDYWHEMLCGVCLVVERDGDHVCICREKQDCGPNRYTFVNPEWLTVEEFRHWLSYERIPGFWADVSSRRRDVSSYASIIPNTHRMTPARHSGGAGW